MRSSRHESPQLRGIHANQARREHNPARGDRGAWTQYNEARRSDRSSFFPEEREQRCHEVFTETPSNEFMDTQYPRLVLPRVTELRRGMNMRANHHNQVPREWETTTRNNLTIQRLYQEQTGVAYNERADDFPYFEAHQRSSPDSFRRREHTYSRDDMSTRFDSMRTTRSLSEDNQIRSDHGEESPCDSPSSYDSNQDSSFSSTDLNAWHDLHIGSSDELTATSRSRNNSVASSIRKDHKQEHRNSEVKPKAARTTTTGVKQSRYFREMDRRIILSRLAKGEKQATLAKEYGVSRSTICNLHKQRDIVLARVDENPLSRHPKKARQSTASTTAPLNPQEISRQENQQAISPSLQAPDNEDDEERRPEPVQQLEFLTFDTELVIEVQSRAVSLLKTKVHDRDTTNDDFKRSCSRLMRLLLEETIGIVAANPHHTLGDVPLADSICVIAMGEPGSSLLQVFRQLEPEISTGLIDHSLAKPSQFELHLISEPSNLHKREILLLEVVLASGDTACAAIDVLRSNGVRADQITLVALFIAAEVIALVQYMHPQVRIITTGVDMQLHHRTGGNSNGSSSSSSRVFLERFLVV